MRWRSLGSVALLLAVFIAGLAGLYTAFTLHQYRLLEQQLALRSTGIARDVLAQEVERLSSVTADWAMWGGLQDYLRTGSSAFPEAEFTPEILSNLRVHAFVVRDGNGKMLYTAITNDGTTWRPFTDEERGEWDGPQLRDGPPRKGLLQLSDIWLACSHPVELDSASDAPKGRILFARRADEALSLHLARLLHMPVRLVPLNAASRMEPALQRAVLAAEVQEPLAVRNPDGQLHGMVVLPDLGGKAVLALQVNPPLAEPAGLRLYQLVFVTASGLAGLCFAALALMVLHRHMLARLPRLMDVVRQVRQQSNFNARVTLGGSPELVQLGGEINGLLDTAQHVHERLQTLNADLENRVKQRTAELEAAQALERARSEQERIYHTMFDLLPTGILLESEQGIILDANPALCQTTGYTRAELVGQPVALLMAPDHRLEVDKNLARLHQGEVLIHEVVNQRKDGSLLTMKLRERALMLDNGERRIIVNAEDVSAQRQAEHYLRLQITALESSVNGIMIVDREGRITWVNRAFSELTGYADQEVIGQNPRLLKSGRHDQHFYHTLWSTILGGHMWRGDMVNRRKDGTLYLEELTITPVLDAQGQATHFVGIKQDITERHNLQQQLYQAQKMEGIGRLAGGIAHDFNNLLQAITGFCTLLLEQMSPESPYRPDVLEIEKAAQRAAALTRQLLAFSRRQMMETKPVNLNRLIENLQKMLQRLLGEDVNLMTDLAPNLDRVRVDPGQIEQVLLNLAVNARDAMPHGGRLTISTYSLVFLKEDTLLVPEARHGRFVCLAMSDTGIGMSREVIDHIFEPFYSTKGPGKGTGLGLSVVYGIVRQHDGMVHVYSQLGEGTTFRIYLPVYSDAEEETVDEEARLAVTQKPAPGVRILLTEDEDGVRDFAVRALRNQGYQVSAVGNAQHALDLFKAEQGGFDLLFTDVVLPDQNGLDMARLLVREKPTLRLLFTSGYMDDKSRWPAIRDHGYRFLQKPYPVQELLRAIQETLAEPLREQTLD